MARAVLEVLWLCYIILDLDIPLPTTPLLLCDNESALALAANPVSPARIRHIEIDVHFVREKVVSGSLRTRHIPSKLQTANIFTKSLSRPQFEFLRTKLNLVPQLSLRGDKIHAIPQIMESYSAKEPMSISPIMESQPVNPTDYGITTS